MIDDSRIEEALALLLRFWEGPELANLEQRQLCRQLEQRVLEQLDSVVAGRVRNEPEQHADMIRVALRHLSRRGPVDRALLNQLTQHTETAQPSISVVGNGNFTVGGSINIGSNEDQSAQPSAPKPITLRFIPQDSGAQIIWEADIFGRSISGFAPPYDTADLPLVLKALDAAQWPGYPYAEPHFAAAEQERLADLKLWEGDRVSADVHVRVGQALYRQLVADREADRALDQARNYAITQREPLSLVLRFPPDAVWLAALPWELLWDAQGALLLSRGRVASCVRYLDLPQAVPLVGPQRRRLRILAVAPVAGLGDNVRRAERAARTSAWSALTNAGLVDIEELHPATPTDLVNRIQNGPPPDIFHFYGHGRYKDGVGELLFDAPGVRGSWIQGDRLAALLGDVQLIMLHACQSAVVGKARLLTGVAPALSAAGVPAVVGMQLTIQAPAAARFAEVTYRALARGDSIQQAVSQARQALYVEESDGASWYVPTLTIRAHNMEPMYLIRR